MTRLVTARIYFDAPEAHVARSVLLQEGIPAFLFDAHYIGVSWHHLVALGGLRLQVFAPDLDAARQLLTPETDGLSRGGVESCPACGSGHVFRARSWIVAALVVLAVGMQFLVPTRRRYCRACKHRWRAGGVSAADRT